VIKTKIKQFIRVRLPQRYWCSKTSKTSAKAIQATLQADNDCDTQI
jgi:hypothetical protein